MWMDFLMAAGTSSARATLRIEKQTAVRMTLAFKNNLPQLELFAVGSDRDGPLRGKSVRGNEILTLRSLDANRRVCFDDVHAKTLVQELGKGAPRGCREDAADLQLLQLGILDDQLLRVLPVESACDLPQRLGVENEQARGPRSSVRGLRLAMFAGLRPCHDRLLARRHQHGAGRAAWGRWFRGGPRY